MTDIRLPFSQRFSVIDTPPISDDIPKSARIALAHLFVHLHDDRCIRNDYSAFEKKVYRAGRFTGDEFDRTYHDFFKIIMEPILQMEWFRLYGFIERVYDRLLMAVQEPEIYNDPDSDWVEITSLKDVRGEFSNEIEVWLSEENLAYTFVGGQFQRRGRAVTQKNVERVGSVLGAQKLLDVRRHYNKARGFFDLLPEPDTKNCIKEALCALEACVEVMSGLPASNNFTKTIKQLQGNEVKEIPPAIAESMIKLFAYRGSGQGVAHAALSGSKVTELEAEVVLNLTASYITYIVDLLHAEEEIPF